MTNTEIDTAQLKQDTPGESLRPRHVLLLMAVSLAVLIPGTIGVSFVDRDEGWYAQVCREMIETGDWLVPHYLGEAWLAKPPLLYWLVSAGFTVLGMGEWQARLTPVLASTLNVVLIAALASRMFGRRVGLLAGLIFVTSGLPAVVGKMLLTDAPMLTCTLTAVLMHWQMTSRGVTALRSAGYWLAIGIGIMAKGPAVLVFAGAFALAALTAPTRRSWLTNWRFWAWLPLAIAVALPWYLLVAHRAGDTLVSQFLWFEIFSRIANTPHGHGGPPGYYILLSLVGLLPWTVFVPGTVLNTATRWRSDPTGRLVLIWLALPWVVLELIHSKLPHYIMPCYVPLAILLARAAGEGMRRTDSYPQSSSQRETRERLLLRLWPGPMIVLGMAGIVVALTHWNRHWSPAAIATGGVLILAFGTVDLLVRKRSLSSAWAGAVIASIAFHLAAGAWLLPAFEPLRLSRNVAEAINNVARPGDQILFCGYDEPTVYFYLRQPGRPIKREALIDTLGAGRRPRVLAITQRELDRLDLSLQSRVRSVVGHRRIDGYNYVHGRNVTIWWGREADG